MNPKQLRVAFSPEKQRWYIVRVQPKLINVIRDATTDMVGCILGEMKQTGPDTYGLVWEFEATAENGDHCQIEMVATIKKLSEKEKTHV